MYLNRRPKLPPFPLPDAASVVAISTRVGIGDAGQALDEFIAEVYSRAYMSNGGIDSR